MRPERVYQLAIATGHMARTRLLFDHAAAQARFGASVFWLRRAAAFPNEQEAVAYWQIKRDGARRGIVEVIPE
jgi:hypothetical protein